MMKDFISKIAKGFLLLAFSIVAGTLLMIAVYAIPADAVRENVSASMDTLSGEGMRYAIIPGYSSSRLDNYTDAVMLGNMVFAPSSSLVENAMMTYRLSSEQPIGALCRFLESGQSDGYSSYSRYWHGYLVLLKPLFLFVNYNSIRVLNMSAQLALVLAVAMLLARRNLSRYALPLLAAYLSLCPIAVMCSLQYTSAFMLSFGAMLCMLLAHERLRRAGYGFFFLMVGILTSFFDFLTYPIATLGLPLALLCALTQREGQSVRLSALACFSLCWGAGYAGMWSGKWLMARLLTGQSVFAEAGAALLHRAGAYTDEGERVSIFSGLTCCLRQLFNPLFALTFVLFMALCAFLLLRGGRRFGFHPSRALPYLLVALLPALWLIFTCNHAVSHTFFTYRSLCVSVFALLCALLAAGGDQTGQREMRP